MEGNSPSSKLAIRAFLAQLRLTDVLDQLTEGTLANIERLASLDALKLARLNLGLSILIGTDDAGDSVESALDSLAGALFDELEILGVGRGRTSEVARFENLNLLGIEKLAKTRRQELLRRGGAYRE